jgi:SAM-dependent methyltransferase
MSRNPIVEARTRVGKALSRPLVRDRITEFLRPYRTEGRVLDLGCGNSPYASLFPNRMCLDLRRKPGAAVVGDAHRLPFAPGSFDLIISTEMLEHTVEPQRIVDEIRRVLRPGGRLLLTTRFIFPLHDVPGDYFRFTNYGLAHLFRDWSAATVEAEATTMETMAVLLQRLAIQGEFRSSRLIRLGLFLGARLVARLGWLITRQYGNSVRTEPVPEMLVTGWHVSAVR